MSIRHVTKSGNDSNSGLTLALAKKTIGGAVSASSAGDEVHVYRGVYKESVSMPAFNSASGFILKAIGNVIIDGENLRGVGITHSFNNTGTNVSTVDGFTIINHTFAGVLHTGNNFGSGSLVEALTRNCIIRNNVIGIRGGSNDLISSGYSVDSQFNTIYDCSAAGIHMSSLGGGFSPQLRMKSNTIFNCGAGLRDERNNNAGGTIFSNILASCGIGLNFNANSSIGGTLDFNDYFGNTSAGKMSSTLYATFAAWKTATGKDASSIGTDPLHVDSSVRLFALQSTSPCVGTGMNGENIGGHGKSMFSLSNLFSPADFAAGIFTDTQIGGLGKIEIVPPATVGTYASVVKDIGNIQFQKITGIELAASELNPLDVVDTDNTDTAPNSQKIEVRMSASSFSPTAGSPAWVALEVGSNTTLPTVKGRYIQFRLTLRNDGVEA